MAKSSATTHNQHRVPASNLPRLVNEHEAALTLGLKVATLRRWRWAGRGPSFKKIGSAVRYDPQDLQAFIESGSRTVAAAVENGRA